MQRRALLAALGGATALGPLVANSQTTAQANTQANTQPRPPGPPQLKALGGERYGVGRIVVEKAAHRFTVPGRVHALGKPLEYLATSPGAKKAYEALLELDASGTEMNLACILIGLERDASVPSWKPLGQAGQIGQRVTLSLAWTESGQRRQVIAAEALLDAEARPRASAVEWAYTGSFTSKDGSQLAADITGTLISFVKKDPTGIIEAVSDISLGPYGAVRGSSLLPPEASAIELIVEAVIAPK